MKNKSFIITIVICITLVITFVLLTSYAYWKVQRTQTGSNDIKGACLDIELVEAKDGNNNPIEGFTLEDAWPLDYYAGIETSGYTFKVINKCSEEVFYEVILDSLPVTEGKKMNSESIIVYLNDTNMVTYASLEEAEPEVTKYEKIDSRRVYTGVVPAATEEKNGEVEHNLKMWISIASTNDDIGKEFSVKVRVQAGQQINYITPESCFDFEESTGTIIGYHLDDCSKRYLVVPETIDGVTVRSIDPFGEGRETQDADFNTDHFAVVDLSKATGLETIGEQAFVGFKGYNLILNSGLKIIGEDAFSIYVGDSNLVIPEGVEKIGSGAFEMFGRGGIIDGSRGTVYLPSTIKEIGLWAFRYPYKIIINMSEEEFNNNVLISEPWVTHNVIFTQQ